jgi:SAM-dependent methyltransferase
MERDAFALMAAAERDHWWFKGRREFIATCIARVAPPPGARLLDAGCGSGGNLALLARFGSVWGFETDADALRLASNTGIGTVAHGFLPDEIPFPDVSFEVIGLFDVLEHLDRPVRSLAALAGRLADGGACVITVPANPWLWGPHDVRHQHKRRYTAQLLRQQLHAAGLRADYLTHFNTLLLPLAIVQRLRERVFGYSTNDLTPVRAVNDALFRIWRCERAWIPRMSVPAGLSLLAIARRA